MSNEMNWIPEGYHSLTPFLSVRDAARAIDFYKSSRSIVPARPRFAISFGPHQSSFRR